MGLERLIRPEPSARESSIATLGAAGAVGLIGSLVDAGTGNHLEKGTTMAMPITEWTFSSECAPTEDIMRMLVPGEEVHGAFRTIRDVAAFTNKRLIVRDAQGFTGKKVEIYSLPWNSVDGWSSENAGMIDINAEIELWTRAGHLKVNLKKDVDIRRIDLLIASCVLQR